MKTTRIQHACATVAAVGIGIVATSAGAGTTSIFFDGAEPGVNPGFADFSFDGANFTQGFITDFPSSSIRASESFSWLPQGGIAGNATITFDTPASEVTFFYAHDGIDVGAGRVDVFEVGFVDATDIFFSNQATFHGDPNNFITINSAVGITKLEFIGQDGFSQPGSVDNFTFTTIPSPGALALIGAAGVFSPTRRRRQI